MSESHPHPFFDFMRGAGGRGRGPGGRGPGPGGPGPGGPPHGGPGFPPPFGGGMWPFFGRGGRGGRGPRARRGDVRAGILALLAEQPRNGYQIMQELEQRSRGMWRPSPGSVYPALQLLEDEGLIKVQDAGGGKVYELTKRGREAVDALGETERAPWDAVSEAAGDEAHDLMSVFRGLAAAAMQVATGGNPAQRTEARKILVEARRALYRILSEDDGGEHA